MNTQVYFDQNGSPMLFSTKARTGLNDLATVADMNNGDYYDDAEEDEMEMMMPEATKKSRVMSNWKTGIRAIKGTVEMQVRTRASTVSFYPQTSSHESMHQNYLSHGQATTRYNKDNKPRDDNTRSKRKRDVEIKITAETGITTIMRHLLTETCSERRAIARRTTPLAIWILPLLLMMMIPVRWTVKI